MLSPPKERRRRASSSKWLLSNGMLVDCAASRAAASFGLSGHLEAVVTAHHGMALSASKYLLPTPACSLRHEQARAVARRGRQRDACGAPAGTDGVIFRHIGDGVAAFIFVGGDMSWRRITPEAFGGALAASVPK